MFMRKDKPFKVARIPVGSGAGMAVSVYAFTADEVGMPTVGLGNHLDDMLKYMTPEIADLLAEGLKRAAAVARGELQRTG